ncbi:MAG: hypothetical protein ACRC6P_16560 [Shewanella oncorhynchi]
MIQKVITVLFLVVASLGVQALTIDTMVLVGDKAGNGVFTLTNDMEYTSFITGNITKYDVNGEVIDKKQYTKDNLKDWEITLSNPKLILEAGRSKQVGVRSLCGQTCDFTRDHVYQINFVPTPYSEDGGVAPIVAVNIGYAPLYIIPALKQDVKFNIKNLGDKIYVENTGNTFFRLGIDQCSLSITKDCRAAFTVLAGRKKYFKLPPNTRSDMLKVVVVNHDNTFVRRPVIKKEAK